MFLGRGLNRAMGSIALLATLAGCVTPGGPAGTGTSATPVASAKVDTTAYVARQEGTFNIPAIPLEKLPTQFQRQVVDFPTAEAPGTVIINPVAAASLFRHRQRQGDPLWHLGGSRGVRMGRRGAGDGPQALADLDPAARDDRAQAGTGEVGKGPARRPREPAWRARPLPDHRRAAITAIASTGHPNGSPSDRGPRPAASA